jgi:hypothetical protein
MSVLADFQVNSLNPAKVSGTGTGDFYFPRPNGSLFVTPTTPSASSAAGQLAYPGESELNGQEAQIVAAGSATTSQSSTVILTLLANTGTVATPAYTTLATVTTGAIATTSISWFLKAHVTVNTISKQLSGVYFGSANNVLVDWTAITATTNPVDPSTTLPFGIVMKVSFGTGATANSANLYQLQVLGA